MTTTSHLAALRAAIENAALTAWTNAGYDAAALNFSNSHFEPKNLDLWGSVSIKFGTGIMLTQGTHAEGGANELAGVVMVQLFVPSGTGSGDIVAAADVLRDCYNRLHIQTETVDASFGAPSASEPAQDRADPTWYMMVVSAPFSFIDAL